MTTTDITHAPLAPLPEEVAAPTITTRNGTVRTLQLDGERWYVTQDIVRQLGLSGTQNVLGKLGKGVSRQARAETPMGRKTVSVIRERDVARVMLLCRTPEARHFQRAAFGSLDVAALLALPEAAE